ncbi:uncharacterized protein J3R85_013104 [Psidium guajava]|nr:uncharacterized protein J3R85_013104 [Psidium guajava]
MQKAVLKLDIHDNKDKRKAMKIVSGFAGVDAIDINLKDQKLTVTGVMDPVELVGKLRKKTFSTDIISVGPAKEAEKKGENKKDDQDKKTDDNKGKADPAKVYPYGYPYYPPPLPPTYFSGRNVSAEEDPNGCVIC